MGVGHYTHNYGQCTKPLIEYFPGGTGSGDAYVLPTPPSIPSGETLVASWLYAVDGTGPNDMWALGTKANDNPANPACTVDTDCANWYVIDKSAPYNVPAWWGGDNLIHACGASGHCMTYTDIVYHCTSSPCNTTAKWVRDDSQLWKTTRWNMPLQSLSAFATNNVDMLGGGPDQDSTSTKGIHWNGSSWTTIATVAQTSTTQALPGPAFATFRSSATSEWVGGEATWCPTTFNCADGNDLWKSSSGTWSGQQLPRAGCGSGATDNCSFRQINAIKPVPGTSNLWAAGTYVDFNQGQPDNLGCSTTADCGGASDVFCNLNDPFGPFLGACEGCQSNSDCAGFPWQASGVCQFFGSQSYCKQNTGLNLNYVAYYNGSTWTEFSVPFRDANRALFALGISSANDIWAAGPAASDATTVNEARNVLDFTGFSNLLHWNGSTWTDYSSLAVGPAFGADSQSAGHVLVVGSGAASGVASASAFDCH